MTPDVFVEMRSKIEANEYKDYDVLRFIYEYLISQFAANAGNKPL